MRNKWERDRDIEEVIRDGVRKAVCREVSAGNTNTAANLNSRIDAIAESVREKMQTAFSIRRPRK